MRRVILDSGPLVAFFSPRDAHHAWALAQTRDVEAPFITCEAVLTEAHHLLGRVPGAQAAFRRWLHLGRVRLPLRFDDEAPEILRLLDQYADLPMDFADACVVRLAETLDLPVFTLDVTDFSVYRVHRNQPIAVICPS